MTGDPGDTGMTGALPSIDTSVAHPARMYDYLLGGTTNFEADRQAVERAADAVGGIEMAQASVRANRAFLVRAVRWLAAEAGVRQFLDVGTGIPTMHNVHEVAQAAAPQARVVYVDKDPIVLAHAHTLLRSSAEGATAYVPGELRDPEDIVAQAADTLDFGQPVALVLVAILHFFPDSDDPYGIVSRLLEVLPTGSYLALTHLAADIQATEMAELAKRYGADDTISEDFVWRLRGEVARFFAGLDLVQPGIVPVDEWRPDDAVPKPPAGWVNPFWCGIGTKP